MNSPMANCAAAPAARAGKSKAGARRSPSRSKGAGATKFKSPAENRRNLAKTEGKEARGETYQQETEGKSHVGAGGRRESSRAQGGKHDTRTIARRAGRKAKH